MYYLKRITVVLGGAVISRIFFVAESQYIYVPVVITVIIGGYFIVAWMDKYYPRA